MRSLGFIYHGLWNVKQDVRLEGGKGALEGLVGSSVPRGF